MAEKKIYFGTKESMRWLKCPNSGMGLNRVAWRANGTYLNGGGWSRSSQTTHFEPSLTWSFLDHRETREIQDYYFGVHGPGPFYWLDPFSMGTNVLPLHWSVPRLAADDAPSLVRDRRPTLSVTAANDIGLPSQTATYTLGPEDRFDTLWIPNPENFAVHVAAWGSSSGTARLKIEGTSVALTAVGTSTPVWTTIQDVPGVNLTLDGEGLLSLAGLVVQVLPRGDMTVFPGLLTSPGLPTSPSLVPQSTTYAWIGVENPHAPRFLSGAGHSGCAFKSDPVPVGYSAPNALDYQSLTADFIEVGAWLS